jgi:hypothetical protein
MRVILTWASTALFAAVGLFLLAFGALYASVQDLLWFHAAAVPENALDAVRPLYFALMDLIGGAAFALGLLGLYLTWGPLRSGARFAMTALGVCYAIPLVMAAIVAERLAHLTNAPTSWHIMGVLLAVTAGACAAHALARSPRFAPMRLAMDSKI